MCAWALSLVVLILAIYVWGQSLSWQIFAVPTYQLFPVFGLVAFSLMWVHYIVSALRQYFGIDRSVTAFYFEVTSWMVLAAILLHPSLLIWQLWRDGLGLPPGSYEMVYGWATLLGTGALFVFLAYEFRRKFGKRSWWKYMQYLSDVAMLVIVYHALRLGTQLQVHWFRSVWYFYAGTLIIALIYIYSQKFEARQLADKTIKLDNKKA